MADGPLTTITGFLRRVAAASDGCPDEELLARYARSRDEEAFALLVRRHGPMILGVCRRALGHSPESEDAFQSTFLALARGAGRVRDCVPGWLYRVAVRACHKALRGRRPASSTAEPPDPADPLAAVEWRDLRRLLDEELDRLPARWRSPLVLCYLEGLTRDEAATQLGWSLRTLHRRLDEGRSRLRARLTRRGLAPAVLTAAVLSAGGLRASVPPGLAGRTISLAGSGAVPPASVRLLIPNPSAIGGLAMRLTACGLLLAGAAAVIVTGRQPAVADPPAQDLPPSALAAAPRRKPPEDPLIKQAEAARAKAVAWLEKAQSESRDGKAHWESDSTRGFQPGGLTALALLALLENGVKPDRDSVARGLAYLRTVEPQSVYVVSLQTQVFVAANRKEDADRVRRNVKWLEAAAAHKGDQLLGWSYTGQPGGRADNSNSRFAVAALHAANRAGFKPGDEVLWEKIRNLYTRTQLPSGGWGYVEGLPKETHTMTAAGALCLALARDAAASKDRAADRAFDAGFKWLAENFRVEAPNTYYNLDVIASLGRANEARTIGTGPKAPEWFREGAGWLLKAQSDDGKFVGSGAGESMPVVATSFALRFLASRPD